MEVIRSEICKLHQQLVANLTQTLQILTVNDSISEVIWGFFDAFAREAEKLSQHELARKARKIIPNIQQLHKHSELQIPMEQLGHHCITISVSHFEEYLRKVFSMLVRKFPTRAVQSMDDLKITKEVLINNGFNISLCIDELILKKDNGINFQDLQSTIRSFKEYTDYDLSTDLSKELQDKIIFLQASRHVIVHKATIIDGYFVSQIKKTVYYKTYKDSIGNKLLLSPTEIKEFVSSLLKFSSLVCAIIK